MSISRNVSDCKTLGSISQNECVYGINSFFVSFTVFIRKDVKGQAQLVLLDHGLYGKLTQDDRQSLCNLYKTIVLNKENNMQKFSKALGVDGKR